MFSIMIMFQSSVKTQAETIGLSDIIFEWATTIESVEHGFLMNQLSYTITKLHLVLAGKDIESINYEWATLELIKTLEELTKTDVIEILNLSPDKQAALAEYLTDCDKNLQQWDTIATYMRQDMDILKEDMQSCIIEKNISDKVYFEAIDRYDQDMMQTALTESIYYETCATENRINYNAQTSILRKLVFYLWILQKKYDVLFAKQDIVTNNYEIFRDNILPDLNQIDELLKQYNF